MRPKDMLSCGNWSATGSIRIPRLTQRRPLTYQATLLLACLREEFCRFDTTAPDATRLVKTRGELHLVAAFPPETTNQVRDFGKVDTAIQKLSDMGFLEKIRDDPEEFEVKRIVKANWAKRVGSHQEKVNGICNR